MIHVYPVNDEREHELEGTVCPCEPHVEWHDPETGEPYAQAMVIHRAFDGRDVIEEAERIIAAPQNFDQPDAVRHRWAVGAQPHLHRYLSA